MNVNHTINGKKKLVMEISLSDIRELLSVGTQPSSVGDPIKLFVGRNVFIRTVTHHHTGHLVSATADWLLLESAAWVADDGRFAPALAVGSLSEVEPFPDGPVLVNRGSVIDMALWDHPLPRTTKP